MAADTTQKGRITATQVAKAVFSSTRHQRVSRGSSTMPPPPPKQPLAAPARTADAAYFAGMRKSVTSLGYVPRVQGTRGGRGHWHF